MIEIINCNTANGIPLPDESIDCVVTSPPYWGLRDYGADGQLGLEKTPQEYVENMRKVFADVRRVLKPQGTLWLNLGDSFAVGGMSNPSVKSTLGGGKDRGAEHYGIVREKPTGLKPKDLIGVPWRVAFSLQEDGWYLRNDIIWHKPNPMPESVTDRCTRAHEYVFHLAKSEKYHCDMAAISECADRAGEWNNAKEQHKEYAISRCIQVGETRNKRTVWTIATQPTPDAHFATYPEKLVEPCILAGCPVGGTVLDPFCGSGTTLKVAERLGRNAIGLELNPAYIEIARRKTAQRYMEFQDVEANHVAS